MFSRKGFLRTFLELIIARLRTDKGAVPAPVTAEFVDAELKNPNSKLFQLMMSYLTAKTEKEAVEIYLQIQAYRKECKKDARKLDRKLEKEAERLEKLNKDMVAMSQISEKFAELRAEIEKAEKERERLYVAQRALVRLQTEIDAMIQIMQQKETELRACRVALNSSRKNLEVLDNNFYQQAPRFASVNYRIADGIDNQMRYNPAIRDRMMSGEIEGEKIIEEQNNRIEHEFIMRQLLASNPGKKREDFKPSQIAAYAKEITRSERNQFILRTQKGKQLADAHIKNHKKGIQLFSELGALKETVEEKQASYDIIAKEIKQNFESIRSPKQKAQLAPTPSTAIVPPDPKLPPEPPSAVSKEPEIKPEEKKEIERKEEKAAEGQLEDSDKKYSPEEKARLQEDKERGESLGGEDDLYGSNSENKNNPSGPPSANKDDPSVDDPANKDNRPGHRSPQSGL